MCYLHGQSFVFPLMKSLNLCLSVVELLGVHTWYSRSEHSLSIKEKFHKLFLTKSACSLHCYSRHIYVDQARPSLLLDHNSSSCKDLFLSYMTSS